MARLEKAKTEWQRFQQEDKAAFERWMASTFGALLSRLRELDAAIEAKEALIEEVEWEMIFGDAQNERSAYREVQNRREHPETESDSQSADDPWPPPEAGEGEKAGGGTSSAEIPEIEQEILFEDFVRAFMGIDPDDLSEKDYQKMFADFQANVLRQPPPRPASAKQPSRQPQSEQSRLKELYRQLVRRLHPDLKATDDAAVSALWHEVQEAYGSGNIERLETLLALTDLQADAIGEQTSLSQMRSVLLELRRSFNSLQRNLRAARKDPAWSFSQLKDRSTLEKKVRRELESTIVQDENLLKTLEAKIAAWSTPRKGRRKSQVASRQAEFLF